MRWRKVFEDLEKYLRRIKEVVKEIDPEAEVYLFGSVAEGRHVLSSDVDILVVTWEAPARMLAELWRAGIREPFEIHVRKPGEADLYLERVKFVQV